MKLALPLLLIAPVLFTFSLESRAQCSAIAGVYDGSPIPGNHYTPYATNTGSLNRRGFRAQYLYPAAELLAAGLCPGPISCISFNALEDDLLAGPGPDSIPGTADDTQDCELHIDLRIGQSVLTSFGQAVDVSDTAVPGWWDVAVALSTNMNTQWSTSSTVHAGWNDYSLMGQGFIWDGAHNIIIDLSWQRGIVGGLSPAVELEENLPYTASKWVQVTSGVGISHGNTYSDSALPLGGTTGITNTRPVTRFNCVAAVGMTSREHPFAFTGHWDAAQGAVVIAIPEAQTGRTFHLSDAAGRTLSTVRSAAGQASVALPVPSASCGVLFVSTEAADRPLRVVVIR